MSNNNFPELQAVPNETYTRNLFTKSLIQNSIDPKSLPHFLEKYTINRNPNTNFVEPENNTITSKLTLQAEVFSQRKQESKNSEKDPRMKSGFYQEKTTNNLNSLISIEKTPRESSDGIFKHDFIPFQTNQDRDSDPEMETHYSNNFNVNNKRIKKIKSFPNKSIQQPNQMIKQDPENPIPHISHQYLEHKTYGGKDLNELVRIEHQKLPIFSRSKVIMESIEKEQVVVISGDTGCGKSTQVPKYIYLNARSKNKKVKIVCTQPRRMAALNLAKRVAFELNEKLGGIVGYQISLDSKQTEHTAILYVTNGIFLQSLIHDKNIFDEVTHVILDEIHERDIDSDFTMIAMKHLLNENPHIKLILMSATINVQLFVNYFSRDEIQNCHNKEYNYSLNTNSKQWEKLKNWEDFDPKLSLFDKPSMEEEQIPWTNIRIKKEREINPYGANKRFDRSKDLHLEQYKINMNDLPACSVEIPSIKKFYHVETFYIDSVEKYLGKQLTNGIEFRYIDFDRKKPNLHNECVQLALEIIKSILTKDDQEKQKLQQRNMAYPKNIDGSFLVFLPGNYFKCFYNFLKIPIFMFF